MPKIFVSYSSANRTEAEALHAALEQDGHEVWRDKTRLETDWSREIAFGLAQSEAICLLWSETAATSRWVRQEFLTARALEKRIFVLFLDKARLPDPLTTLDGDFTPAGLRDRIGRASDFTARYDFTAAAAPVFIPFRPNAEFRGRHADLLEIYLGMIGNLKRTGISLVGAVGAGGIGKTQLAVEFAWRFAFAFAGIYWIQAADEGSWEQQLVEIARNRLGLSVENPSGPQARHDYLVALQEHCRRTPNVLLIFDNVPDPAQRNNDTLLDGPPPLDLGASVLFTTRRRSALPGVTEHAVDMLSSAAAEQVLTAGRPAASPPEQQAAAGICSGVTALAITPDGKYALTGNSRGHVSRWNLGLRDLDRVFEGHNDAVRALAIAPDGSTALTGSEDQTLILWDLTSPGPHYGESHWSRVHGLAFSLDGRHLLSGAGDTSLILWDVAERRCLRKFKNESGRVEGVALSADGARALAGDDEGGVTVWDLKTFKPLHRYEGLGENTSLPAFVFGRPCILARDGEAGEITVLDTGERKRVRVLPTGQYGGADGFSFTNDGRRALSCADQSITLWDMENGEPLRQWPVSYFSGDSMTFYRAALTLNDTRLVTVGGDNSLNVWDMESGHLVTRVYLSSPTIAVAAHQSTIAVGDSRGKVYFLTIDEP